MILCDHACLHDSPCLADQAASKVGSVAYNGAITNSAALKEIDAPASLVNRSQSARQCKSLKHCVAVGKKDASRGAVSVDHCICWPADAPEGNPVRYQNLLSDDERPIRD